MENIVVKRLESLRVEMAKHNIDAYIIPTNDYHGSEYVSDFFKQRAYMSGFTGSAGTLVVFKTEAYLFTDGRYFLQAEKELLNSSINLLKMGEVGVPSLNQLLESKLTKKSVLGFDGKVLNYKQVKGILDNLKDLELSLVTSFDLVGKVWDNRPLLDDTSKKVYVLDKKYCGVSTSEKLEDLRNHLNKVGADFYLLSSLDDIAWLLNLRGDDVKCNPVFLSYVLVSLTSVTLYINKEKLTDNVIKYLDSEKISFKEYLQVYDDLKTLNEDLVVLLDLNKVNYELVESISCSYIHEMNYTTIQKAIKNEAEISGAYNAHIFDGVALTKLIYRLKHRDNSKYSEMDIVNELEALRKERDTYIGISFDTIAGYKENGAIIHYEPTIDSFKQLDNESFLLLDSGGQYLEGTTDVTRTISLGKLSTDEITHYTLCLKGHLALTRCVFKEGLCGASLDIIARSPLYEHGLNYNHGTGHGVGSLLNVHEGPQNINPSYSRSSYPFKAGMITSNEPGLYFEGKYGIRIENLILCVNKYNNEFGSFLGFDSLTLAPYDVEAIDKSLLSSDEILQLHIYHERVYNTLSKYLSKEEQEWLMDIVRAF